MEDGVPREVRDSHARTVEDALRAMGLERAHAERGLSGAVAKRALEVHGQNALPPGEATPLWRSVAAQFDDTLVQVLLAAAGASFVLALVEEGVSAPLGAFVEPGVILLILAANAAVGVAQETSAARAIDALAAYAPDWARVLRDGVLVRVRAADVVPGDVLEVAVGDRVPADARVVSVLSGAPLRVDQSVLTGESVSVEKRDDVLVSLESPAAQDMGNVVFAGTTVTSGRARALVTATGGRTAVGAIEARLRARTAPVQTPLQARLDEFGAGLARAIAAVCVLVWAVNVRRFWDPLPGGVLRGAVHYLKVAVALAVAAIPEGLAVIATTCLALGTRRMAAKRAIVRSLPSVETLGCTTVICSDKTGTLTSNRMVAVRVLLPGSGREPEVVVRVEGADYAPAAASVCGVPAERAALDALLAAAAVCNDARIEWDDARGAFVAHGEPTEAALLALVERLSAAGGRAGTGIGDLSSGSGSGRGDGTGVQRTITDGAAVAKGGDPISGSGSGGSDGPTESESSDSRSPDAANRAICATWRRAATLDFDRSRKSMSVLAEGADGRWVLLAKGAPESVAARCGFWLGPDGARRPLTEAVRASVLGAAAAWGADDALRVLALARVEHESLPGALRARLAPGAAGPALLSGLEPLAVESGMTLLGLVGMRDPPRPEAAEAVGACKAAGIRVVVVTGDNRGTAEAVCRSIGVLENGAAAPGESMTGREFDALDEGEKRTALKTLRVLSRVEPAHKEQVVALLQAGGDVVAMTGDGVNDAPALRAADIGVAMGSGTDVARLAADMVLADDNFATIVAAVAEGRAMYANTRQFIRYLLSSNVGEVAAVLLASALGVPATLSPVQLLWVNLVTDGLPATALGFNPPDAGAMRQPPRRASDPIVGRAHLLRYVVVGAYVGFATVGAYCWAYVLSPRGPRVSLSQLCAHRACGSGVAPPAAGCAVFSPASLPGRAAATMALSVMVVVEMANALNSLGETASLLSVPPWRNSALVAAVVLSLALHAAVLHVPAAAAVFGVVPLDAREWAVVLALSLPVILVDEALKLHARRSSRRRAAHLKAD